MSKIWIITIMMFSILTAFAIAQQCEIDGDCTGQFCTETSHKTYSATCVDSTCIQGTSYDCVVGSCGALCAADTDCSCPYTDTCEGPDKIDYPDFGSCGTAGSEGCLCQIDTGTGGDCEATIIPNDPGCLEQNCQEIEIGSVCIADGQAEITYEWDYPACGNGRTEQVEDPECGCIYTTWENEICVHDGLRAQTRLDYSPYDYCNIQYQEIPDPTCDCISSESDRSCIFEGTAEVTYNWNFQYCGSSFTENVADDLCNCDYTQWTDLVCVANNTMQQQRREYTNYDYCTGELSRTVTDEICACVYTFENQVCVADGLAEFGCTWNFQYCGNAFTLQLPQSTCSCVYSEWSDQYCISEGEMYQERYEITDFPFCQDFQNQNIVDGVCDCSLSETGFSCISDGFADVSYEWNYEFCSDPVVQAEARDSCDCVYAGWQDDVCISDGLRRQYNYETSDFVYCENRLVQSIDDSSCSCVASESGRECVADNIADVIYTYNFDYCSDPYVVNEQDASCACLYGDWEDLVCASDGVMQQQAGETSEFSYCPNVIYQEVDNNECACIASEESRVCESDGFADVTYEWNFAYCPESYVLNEQDDACLCVYSDWITTGCVGFKQRGFSRQELSGYYYCEDPLYQVLKDGTCNTVGDNGVIPGFGVEPQNFCPEILQEHGTCSGQDGGSVCYHVDTTADIPKICNDDLTCVSNLSNDLLMQGIIGRSYAFEGETVNFTTSVFDKDGIIDDCVHVYVTLDNGEDPVEAGCRLIKAENWTDLHTEITYNNALGHYECTYTVEPAEGGTYGEYWLSVKVIDGCGQGCSNQAAGVVSLFLNPVVSLTIESQDAFGFMYAQGGAVLSKITAGSTVYSPYFRIENTADASSGLYMLLRLYGTDMYDYSDSAALCPDSNVLTADHMEYKAMHLNALQPWTTMPRGENAKSYVFDNVLANFLGVGDDLTMRLRLNIPTPCTGSFMDGGEIVFVGEVI
ncbi:MAG: hypothetical protein ABIJ34_01670 [archaeon]